MFSYIHHIFSQELWLSAHNQCNYEQPAGVSAFSALWGTPPAVLHSQPLAASQWDTCQWDGKVKVDFCNFEFHKTIYHTVLRLVCRLLLLLQKASEWVFKFQTSFELTKIFFIIATNCILYWAISTSFEFLQL